LAFSGVPRKLTPVSLPPGRPSWAAKPDPMASRGDDHGRFHRGQLPGELGKTFGPATGPAGVEHDVASLHVALRAQPVDQRLLHCGATRDPADAEHADSSWLFAGLGKRSRQHERGHVGEREPASSH
jgi:hypothetical protein